VSPTAALPAETAELVALQAAVAGRYALERELGRGGMGVVYLARDLALGRPVALKVLPPDLAARPDRRERFLRETRTAAALTHPNIVPIHAVDERDGVAFYVMGYVDGETLTERVRRTGPLPAGEVARVLQEAGWALSYAHGRGIVHRDVKADNILIERGTGRVFLTDFGIAHVAHSTLTTAGESLGTPQYMSPEQAAGEVVDARSDLYSLGIAGFFALTGRLPFEAPNAQAVLAMQVTRPAPPVAAACPGIPTRLAAAVDRCLLKDPQARWASADAFVVAVRAVEGAATGDVAPQVRNFQRFAEVTLTQLVTLYLTFPVLAFTRPAAADLLIAIPLVVSAVVLLQLADRASLLLRQGFTYRDVEAAFAADARQRREEAEALRRAVQPRSGAGKGFVVVGAVGLLVSIGGVYEAERWSRATTLGLLARGAILLGAGVIAAAVVLGGPRRPEGGAGTNWIAARLWGGAFGRWFFALAGRLTRRRNGPQPRPVDQGTTLGRQAAALVDALPTEIRKGARDMRRVIATLEEIQEALLRREHDVEASLAEAGAQLVDADRERVGALRAAGNVQQAELVARRVMLVESLEAARRQAAEGRAAAAAALENLRVQLLRVRAGLGRAEELLPDMDAARQVIHDFGSASPSAEGSRAR